MKINFEPRLERTWIAAGTAVVGIGTQVYSGIKQKQEAKKLAAANQYSSMGIPREELQNQQIAQNQALQGLPSQQYQQSMQNIQRQQQMALRGAQDRRSGIGLVGSVQQAGNDAQGKLDAENANARLNNVRQLFGVNNQVAAYRSQDYRQNEENRRRNYDYSQQLLGAGNANILGAVDSGLAAATSMAGRGLFGRNGSSGLSSGAGLSSVNSPVVSSSGLGTIAEPPLKPLNVSFV